jgi:uncharacterized membrane protein YjgN (DUF898 family)
MALSTTPTAADAPVVPQARGRFLGESRAYFRLLSRDAVQLVATLGLYRFWVASDIRRYLWSNTEIAGDELEYTGDPFELLVGFLLLVVVLCPLFAAASLLALGSGQIVVANYLTLGAIVCLAPIAVLALYQARRYRLSHTIFRGLRFRQRGSAWIYALLTGVWFIVNMMTLGLSYPLARKSLERYKMRHTFYGDLQGDFQGKAGHLFKIGFILWLVVLGPAIWIWIAGSSSSTTAAQGDKVFYRGLAWIAVVGLLIYPMFHANMLRWKIGGIRFGSLTLAAPFSTWALYKAYLRFLGVMVLFVIAMGIPIALWQYKIDPLLPKNPHWSLELIGVIARVTIYFIIATVVAFTYQATVRLTLWRLIVNSLTLSGIESLDRAKAIPGWSPHHEGRIGGALNIGGF